MLDNPHLYRLEKEEEAQRALADLANLKGRTRPGSIGLTLFFPLVLSAVLILALVVFALGFNS